MRYYLLKMTVSVKVKAHYWLLLIISAGQSPSLSKTVTLETTDTIICAFKTINMHGRVVMFVLVW